MKKLAAALLAFLIATPALAAPPPTGLPAPTFSVADTQGAEQSLQKYHGRTVVLEWTNPACPYVGKHYSSGNMQALQKKAMAAGVVWISVVSSAQGHEGFMTPADANDYMTKMGVTAPRILDVDGMMGRSYGATATPDMYVINKNGVLVYEGAIDNMPTTRPDSVKIADNYVWDALTDLSNNRPVRTPVTQPYGCSVKYAD